jgi:hypothetical protein
MSKNKILIATSIAPFGIENQRKAVQSWLDAGFDVISCNAADEAEQVKPYFPDVRFVELPRDGRSRFGKPYPYAYDIFTILIDESADVCGFINSDIHISKFPGELMTEIYNEAMCGRFIYAHRIDTKSLSEDDKARGYYYGIDIFICHRNILKIYPNDEFSVGKSVWDYWAILLPYLKGVEIVEIKNNVFYHIAHDVRWQESDDFFTNLIIDKYYMSVDREEYFEITMRIMARKNNALYYKLPQLINRKVLAIVPENIAEETSRSVASQVYVQLDVRTGTFGDIDTAGYDYIFLPQNGHVYAEYAAAVLVHELEAERCDKIVCASALLTGDVGLPPRHICSFYIDNNPVLVRTIPKYAERTFFNAVPMSSVTNYYILCCLIAKLGKLYLYSASATTKWLLMTAKRYNIKFDIIGICDKNSELWGTTFCGYEVSPSSVLENHDIYENVLITPHKFEKDIYDEIVPLVPREKINLLSEIIKYDTIREQESQIQCALNNQNGVRAM